MAANRYYGSELRPNSGKRIVLPASTASPYATSINDTTQPVPRRTRSPGPSRPFTPVRTPWATGEALSDVAVPQFNHSRKGAGSPLVQRPWAPSAAPFATENKVAAVFVEPAVKEPLDNIHRRGKTTGPNVNPYRPSTGGVPYGTENNWTDTNLEYRPSRSINAKSNLMIRSEVAPWQNHNNMYECARNGKRIAVEKFLDGRPQSAKERRNAYGQDLLKQIRDREQAKARAIVEARMYERKNNNLKSMSALTRGIGERRPWMN